MAKQSMYAGKSFVIAAGQIAGLGIRFLTNILLAWFLLPEDFGIAAIVSIILTGMALFSDIGIRDSVIRHDNADLESFNSSAQALQIIRGFVLFAILILLAPLFSSFYEVDILDECLVLAGTSMIARGYFSTRFYRLEREMRVMPMVVVDLVSAIVVSIIIVALAYYFRSVWVLMASYVIGDAVRTLISHYYSPNKINPFKADYSHIPEIFSFGKWVFLSTLFTFLIIHSDRLFVGKLVDIGTVGVYHLAASLAALLFGVTTSLAARVVYPSIANSDRNGQKNLSLQLDQVLHGFMPFLVSGTLIVFAMSPLFFHYLYPEAYNEAGYLAQLMTLTFWYMIIYTMVNVLPIALNQPRVSAELAAVTSVIRISLSLLGFYFFHLPGFIIGLGIGSFFGFVFLLVWLKKKAGIHQIYLLKISIPVTGIILISLAAERLFTDQLLFQWCVLLLLIIGVSMYLYSSYQHLIPKLISRLRSVLT